jgi:hypothetical protein
MAPLSHRAKLISNDEIRFAAPQQKSIIWENAILYREILI